MRLLGKIRNLGLAALATVAATVCLYGQNPTTPSKEYIRLGDRVIAIENPPAGPVISFGTPTTGLSIGSGGATGSVAVTTSPSNTAWTATSDSSWFQLTGGGNGNPPVGNSVSGTGSTTSNPVTYTVQANPFTTSRSATVSLTGGARLVFVQSGTTGNTLTISPTSATIGSNAPQQSFQVTSTASWTASSDSGWLTDQTTSGSTGTTTLYYMVSANTTGSSRTGHITVVSGSNSQVFTVVQNAATTFTIAPAQITILHSASVQFTAYIDGDNVSSQVTWTYSRLSGHGTPTLSSTGYFTAPSQDSQFEIFAAYSGLSNATALVTVATSTNPITLESVTPQTGIGSGTSFTLKVKDANGWNDLQLLDLQIGSNPNTNCTSGGWPTSTSQAFADLGGPGTGNYVPWTSGATFLQGYSPQQCDLTISSPTVSASESWNSSTNEFTLSLPLSFHTSTFSGSQPVLLQGISRYASDTPQVQMGTYTVVGAPVPGLTSPVTGTGSSQTFTATYQFTSPATSIGSAELLIHTNSTNLASSCDIRFDNTANKFYLRNDAGTGWVGGNTQGTSFTIQNSQCVLSSTGLSAHTNGNTLTLIAPITFNTGFLGSKFTYVNAVDNENVSSGYQQLGSWTVDQLPTGVSITPASGTGFAQTFSFVFADLNGATDLTDLYGIINTSASIGGCTVRYLKSAGGLELSNGSGGWYGPVSPGTANTLSNSVCSLNALASSVTSNGNAMTISAALTFTAALSGTPNEYLAAYDAEGGQLVAGTVFGTWTVPASVPITVTSSPAGLQMTADAGTGSAVTCTSPCVFNFIPNSVHPISANPQSGGSGIQYALQTFSITTPLSAQSYPANFVTQYYLTVTLNPTQGGTTNPTSGWFNSGSIVAVSANPYSGYSFTGFSGALTGTTTPQNLTMSGPESVTASFNGSTNWYSTGGTWAHRKSVTVNHAQVSGSSSLVNFPVLFSVTDPNLATVANGGSVGKSDGTDILFTAADGLTKLNHELESYNPTTGAVVAWVQVPSVSPSADTPLYIYYGNASASNQQNPAGVWDSNYKGVYHFGNGTTLSASDSTSNANNGTITGAVAASGKMGGAGSFNSANGDNISIASLFGSPAQATIEAWVNLTSHGTYGGQVFDVGQGIQILSDSVDGGGSQEGTFHGGLYYTTGVNGAIQGQGWQHLVYTINPAASSEILYLNGVQVASNNYSPAIDYPSNPPIASIGINQWWNTFNFGGLIDEVRASSVVRSSDWILTEFRNENSPSTFLSIGAQQ